MRNTISIISKKIIKSIILKYKINSSVILSSGKRSDYYYDIKSLLLNNTDWKQLENIVIEDIRHKFPGVTYVMGYGIGGIVFAMRIAGCKKFNINPIIVRKEKKEYGLLKQIEGCYTSNTVGTVIVDDVCTTGKNFFAVNEIAVANKIKILGNYVFLKRKESNFNCESFISM